MDSGGDILLKNLIGERIFMTVLRKYVACLLCGGKGSRICSVSHNEIPKSLLLVGGKVLLRYTVDQIPSEIKLLFLVGYQSEQIISWVNEHKLPHEALFLKDESAGIMNAVRSAAARFPHRTLIVCNTDEVRLGFSLEEALLFHENGTVAATMVATQSSNLHCHRVLRVGNDDIIVSTQLKGKEYLLVPNRVGLINAGIVILDPIAFSYLDSDSEKGGWSGIIDPLVAAQQMRAFIKKDVTYFNVGTPGEYAEAKAYFEK